MTGKDRLVRSSLYLLASNGAMAVLGFGFWVVVARIYPPEQVGAGTSLVSALALIAYLSLLGLNGVIVRFVANSKNPDAQVTQSLLIVGCVGLVVSGAYVVLVPFYAPTLSFVRDNSLYALIFLVAGVASSVNLLTDAVFIGRRRPEYNLYIDGFVQGLSKLTLPAALIGLGAFGIFGAVAGSYVVSVVVSIVCMRRVLQFRFDLRPQSAITRAQVNYSFASYLSSGLAVVPTMVLPLIALEGLGSAQTAYFVLTFQIANTLYGISYAIGEALFAEGSFDESRLVGLLKRSALLLVTMQLPAVIVVATAGPFVLGLFGHDYREHGHGLLLVLAVAAIAVALHTWADFLLKLVGLMKSLVVSGIIYVAITVGVAMLWASRGLEWFGWAFLAGNLVSALFAVAAIICHEWRARRRHTPASPGVLTLSGSRPGEGR